MAARLPPAAARRFSPLAGEPRLYFPQQPGRRLSLPRALSLPQLPCRRLPHHGAAIRRHPSPCGSGSACPSPLAPEARSRPPPFPGGLNPPRPDPARAFPDGVPLVGNRPPYPASSRRGLAGTPFPNGRRPFFHGVVTLHRHLRSRSPSSSR
ncbi:translation initiation factor IF-2-like [Zea mays]|uniref:Uncharacterized protein n=1 Tax=Zea mays TaxID=4577 RepID=B8A1M5_MAIZE|nr:translation initiation factor IF-2-like [Zea mays]ACL54074.1 unknown [Zea mays]|eukprot:XP_020403669.1 uncharacterized protein LOC109943947 [Zea mays]